MSTKKRKSSSNPNTTAKWTKHKPVSDSVVETYFDPVHTRTVLPLKVNDNDPLLFYIPGLDKINIDMSRIWLKMKLRVLAKNSTTLAWEPLKDGLKLAPICGLFYTLFSDIELLLNDELVDSSKQNYQVYFIIISLGLRIVFM